MRLGKIFGWLTMTLLIFGLFACDGTVSSTDASENDGLDAVPGYHPGKTKGSSASAGSSSSAKSSSSVGESSSSVAESSSAEEESSSSEEESSSSVDFSDSKIQVDESGFAVITDDYLRGIDLNDALSLDSLREKLENGDNVDGFTDSGTLEFAVDDFNFTCEQKTDTCYSYYCYTNSSDWLEITKDKLLETKLPFLWDGAAYDLSENYRLDFSTPCQAIYKQEKKPL